jgi:hypothetical protein
MSFMLTMGPAFWVRRFCFVFLLALVIITGAQRLKGHAVADIIGESVLWAAISAAVFTAARIYHSQKGRHCALCGDTPEMQQRGGDGDAK